MAKSLSKCIKESGLDGEAQQGLTDRIRKVAPGLEFDKPLSAADKVKIQPILVDNVDRLVAKSDQIYKQAEQKKAPPITQDLAKEGKSTRKKTAPIDTPIGITSATDGLRPFALPRIVQRGKNKGKTAARLVTGMDKAGNIKLGNEIIIDNPPETMRFQPADIRDKDQDPKKTVAQLKDHHGIKIQIIDEPPPDSHKDLQLAQDMLESFGRNVVWFVDTSRDFSAPNGFVMPGDKRTIYLNVMGTNMPLAAAGHELIHSIRNDNPELYAWLHEAIGSDVVDFHEYFMDYNEKLAMSNLKPITEEAAYEELYGDLIGEAMLKRSFWDSVFELAPPMAKRLARAVKAVLDKILDYLKYRKVPEGGKYFSDIDKAHSAIKYVLSAEYNRIQSEFGTPRDRLPFMKDGKITNALKLFYGNPDTVPDTLVDLVRAAGGQIKDISKTLQLHGYHKFIADRAQSMAMDAERFPFPSPELTAARVLQYHKMDPKAKDWYRGQKYLEAIVQSDDELEVFRWLAVLAHTSMNKTPLSNMTEFIKVRLAQRSGGKLPNTLAGERIDRVLNATSIEEMFDVRAEGKRVPFVAGETKVKAFADTFAAALREDNGLMETMQSVIDIWMMRYFFPTDSERLPTGKQRSRTQKHLRETEAILKESTGEEWSPDQVQAAIWFWVKDQYKYHQGSKAKEGHTYDQALEIKTQNWLGTPRDESIEPKFVKAFINQNLRDATVQIHLDHYSAVEDLQYTDPEYQGTGRKGKEGRREVKGPNATFFFFRNDMPEMQFMRSYKYRAVVQGNLYDLTKDPDGLKTRHSNVITGTQDAYALKTMEEDIIKRGYSGFTEDRDKHKITVLFEPTKVHKLQTYQFGVSAKMTAKQKKLAEKYEEDKFDLADILEMFELQKSRANNDKVAGLLEDELRKNLDHPLIDFVSYRAGDGAWMGKREFAPEVTVSAGDLTILKGKFARFLKKYRQDSGLISIPFEENYAGKRPREIPATQAQSFVIEPDFLVNNKHLNTISRLFTENGIKAFSFVPETNQLTVHHVKSWDKHTKAHFEKSVSNSIKAMDNFFKRGSFEVGRMWFKHETLENNWEQVNKNKKGEVTLDGRKGEFYDKIIERGNTRERDLALGYSPPVITGRNKEGTPVLAGKPNKPQSAPKNKGQITSDYQYLDEATKARWAEQGLKTQPKDMMPPKKTRKGYKLFRTLKTKPGQIFPLFIGKGVPTPIGEWIPAEFIPTKGFADRPGWHLGNIPYAPWLMKKDGTLAADRLWAEVEYPIDVDWQAEADKSKTKDIRDRVPDGGSYRFQRPAGQGEEWIIAGAIRVNKILSPEEVDSILAAPPAQEPESIDPKFSPSGYDSRQNKTYKTYSEASKDDGNILVRPGNKKGKYLLVQISSGGDRYNGKAENRKEGLADEYYRSLYELGVGYQRPDDFWEIPEWVAIAAKTFKDSDFYVVRNLEDAKAFLNKEKYDHVMFSVMDANKDIVENIVRDYDGDVLASGYVRKDYFDGNENVTWVDTMQEAAKTFGVKFVQGVDYKHFNGTKTIPRLELSRGCLHNCAFCTVESELVESSDAFINEQIESFKNLDYKLIYLNDKTFGQAKNYTKLTDIHERVKKANPDFEGFVIQTTAPAFNKMDSEWLSKSGIKYVELGMESYNNDILKKIKKPHNTKLIDQAVEKIRALDMKFVPNVIVGLAGVENGKLWTEDSGTYQNTLDFLDKNRDIITHTNTYVLATYEGTQIANQLQTESQEDSDENIIEKSWLEGQSQHEKFYQDILTFSTNQLRAHAETPAGPKFQPGGFTQGAQRVGDQILRAVDKAESAIDTTHPIEKDMAHKIGPSKESISTNIRTGTKKYLAKQGRERMYTQLVDRLRPLKQLGDTTYMLGRGETGTQAIMSMLLEHGKIRIDESGIFTTDERSQGFLPFIEKVGKDWKPFLYWMAAKRSQQLDLEGRENWLSDVDRRSIFSKTRPEDDAQFQAYAEEMDEWQKSILDLGEQAGLINKEARKQWDHMHYIPFYRIFEDEGAREQYLAAPKGSKLHTDAGIKQLVGAEKRIGSLQENLFRNWFHIIHESQRNLTRREAARFSQENDLNSVFEIVKKVPKRSLFYVERTNPDTGKVEREYIPRREFGNILTYREDGLPVHALVHDPDLFEAITDMNGKTFDNLAMKMFRKTKQWLTFGATIGPAFRMANLLRDTMHTALINKTFTPFLDTWRGFMKSMREDEDYVKFMASGFGFGSSYVKADDPQAVDKFINKIVSKEGKEARGRILDTPRKLWAFWEKVGSASENAARVQLYSKLKGEGYSNLQAGFEGRDLLDFTLSGASNAVRAATQMIPFLNARMQGLYKIGRTAKASKYDEAIRKNLMLRGTIMMAASLALYALAPDDEWEELEDWDKMAYYHFWIGDQHFRVPKPFEMGAILSTMPTAMAETLAGDEDGKYLWDVMKDVVVDTFRLDVPQLVKPPIELWANKSFFTGRKIIPEYLRALPPGEQAKQSTSETAQAAGRALGISPLKIEHLAQAYWATFGQTVLDAVDMVTHNALDFPEDPSLTIRDYPLLGRFIRGKDEDYIKQLSWYYETLAEIDGMYKAVNRYKRSGDIEKAKDLRAKYDPDIKKRPAFHAAKKQLSNIRKQIERIYTSKTMSPAEKRRQLNILVAKRNRIVTKLHEKIG